jgi:hypothetical protein
MNWLKHRKSLRFLVAMLLPAQSGAKFLLRCSIPAANRDFDAC